MTRFLFPLILIAIALFVFFTFTDGMWQQIRDLKTQKVELEMGINQANELLRRQQELLKSYNAIADDQKERLDKLLPDNIDNVRLIIDMNNIAKFHGMSLRGVSVSGGEAGAQPSAESQSGETLLSADSVVISFSVSASYEAFKEFLRDLSTSLRLVDVASLSISTGEKNLYSFTLGLKTYWLK